MSPLLVSATFLFLAGAVAASLYAALYGSHRVMQERFDEMTLELRTAAMTGEDYGQVPHGVGRSLLQWALQRIPAPKKTRATEKLAQTLVQAGFRRSNAVRVFVLIRLSAVAVCATLGFAGGAIYFHGGSKMLLAGMGGVEPASTYRFTFCVSGRASARRRLRASYPTCSTCWWSVSRLDCDCSRRSMWSAMRQHARNRRSGSN